MPEADSIQDYNKYINSEFILSQNRAEITSAKVLRRCKDKNGKLLGTFNKSPQLDTRIYNVMFHDGGTIQYTSNIIDEIMHS